MKIKIPLLVSFLVFIAWGIVVAVKSIELKNSCTGFLVRAANSNTIELASQELERAVRYIEAKELTFGYTSVLLQTPDEDIGFWYKNVSASLQELRATKPDASQLEKSNMLMKLRETLTDPDGSVTCPRGLSRYPNNAILGVVGLISFLGLCVYGFLYAEGYE